MKILQFIFALFLLSACNAPDQMGPNSKAQINYPANLQKIFDKHGGLAQWNKMKTLSYEIEKEGGNEKQTIQLQDRCEKIEASNYTSGYDGTKYWLKADSTYKGNVIFYTNLMFYFYAMPFVLADEGIIYEDAAPLEFEGKSYPGIRISYNDGVGLSSKDEYFIHYNPETYQMEWLGYTVTFKSQTKSETVKWIRYDEWNEFNGVVLPKSINWHKMEEGVLVPARRRNFVNVSIDGSKKADSFYKKMDGAEYVEK